jgi:murein DD-endopeptidase MepM/ murein hydrolase activator NlpD
MTHGLRFGRRWLPWSIAAVAIVASGGVVGTSARIGDPLEDLRHHHLLIPVQGVDASKLTDTFKDARAGGVPHDGIDILAPRRTPVLAVEGGTVEKLFTSERGGLTIYQFDPSRTYTYYYAHLDAYAGGLSEHARVARGQVIGYVGTTGNAPKNTPHLHFEVMVLTPAKQWWKGTDLDPFLIWRKP